MTPLSFVKREWRGSFAGVGGGGSLGRLESIVVDGGGKGEGWGGGAEDGVVLS